ncbi:TPA: hypothetical protein ACUNC9_002743 [Escherichia coli]|uniref:hypothetical protein n=1 Tax=Escherichia coli TaxID=562 RepID=UPI000A6A1F0E|nr:hypothetical protein [Escherichia coli]MDF8851886.1 hypothetical protein [Escherichia coli]HBH5047940.1 hypothetical protein [Escherichia coli]HBH5186429.1 hypothetical protein [Escherichia coli]HBN4339941.1 hypothetical protein [Escherichia coli]HDD9440506.1 hypothetical protein [Escherichia coli]
MNALSALHVQSRRPDKTRHASHPAIAPRHWRMRRKRLIRPTCAIPQVGYDAASVASGNCTAPLADAA